MTTNSRAALETALAYHRAWTSHDFERAMTYVADDIVCQAPAGTLVGADASFMPMLCRGGSAPSGPKGSVPCPFDACSQANNTAAAFPPAVRIAIARCVGSWFVLSSARAPSRSTHCGQEV